MTKAMDTPDCNQEILHSRLLIQAHAWMDVGPTGLRPDFLMEALIRCPWDGVYRVWGLIV